MNKRQVWKTDSQSQLSLLPPSYDDLVPINHSVRVVNTILDSIDLSSLEATYKGGGTSSYHPRILLKILVYAYLRNLYSSRKIEQALGENVHFMWLSGGANPDHNTISNFRSGRLKGRFKKIFNQVVVLLAGQGLLSLRDIYVDGTKIEANANRYTFVWAKSIKTSRKRIEKQLKELWSYVEKVYAEEEQLPNEPRFEAIDPGEVAKTVEAINGALQDREVDKKVKQKLNYAKRNWPSKIARYNEQEEILGQRGSYSKTDPGATFMRMKDDHMKNGQLKAGHNIQGSSNNQFLVNYTVEQTLTDTTTLPDHFEEHQRSFGQMPDTVTADAGYGSEQNYQKMEDEQIEAFVKYNYFHKEQQEAKSGKTKKPFASDKLYYSNETDSYYCPMGQEMENIGSYALRPRTDTCRPYTGTEQRTVRAVPYAHCAIKLKATGSWSVTTTSSAINKRQGKNCSLKKGLKNANNDVGTSRQFSGT
jgi:transposase